MIERKYGNEQELVAVAPVTLLIPEVAPDYGLPVEHGKPLIILNAHDNGQVFEVGGIVESPRKPSWDGLRMGVEFHQVSPSDLDRGIGLSRYSDVSPNLGGWVAVLEPLDSQSGDDLGIKVAERARVKAIRAFDSFQYAIGEIKKGFVVAGYGKVKLYPVSSLKGYLNPSYRFSIGKNGQVSFSH